MNDEITEAFREAIITEEKITLNVKKEWKQIKEDNGWTWKEIMGAGILAKQNNPQLIDRIHKIEYKQDKFIEKFEKIENEVIALKKHI